jgi:hypothetical protein
VLATAKKITALYHVSFKNYIIGDTLLPRDWGNAIESLDR